MRSSLSTCREANDASHAPAAGLTDDLAVQAQLVAALREAARTDDPDARATVLETHISYVLLAGGYAYKIKKAVNPGFLDYRTLERRRHYCEEELRLNRRLAPALYLDVVPITGSIAAPVIGGTGAAIEYAVRMRAFPQEALAPAVLARGQLSPQHLDRLAHDIAAFHEAAAGAPAPSAFGTPDAVLRIALRNFAELAPLVPDPVERVELEALADWTHETHRACATTMARRRRQGFVREAHGDLHLGNIVFVDDRPLIFDCIEFDDALRWIDVMSEIAFTTMDLAARGRADLAWRFLDAYLQESGDYDGLCVLRFYVVYRAMVRAKVARLRAQQLSPGAGRDEALADYRGHLRAATAWARRSSQALVITHGLAGSGKTTETQGLLEAVGAIRIRTDVERKRLHGVALTDRSRAGELYPPAATRRTYRRALALARRAVAAGFVTIVDGAFLAHWQRQWFRELAAKCGVPFVIASFVAPETTLRARLARRVAAGADASDADAAVLDLQLRTQEPLTPAEFAETIVCATDR